jgi:hypothetical protein
MNRDTHFYVCVDGEEGKRYMSRNFGPNSQPNVTIGTKEGAIHIVIWEEDGVVMALVTRGQWRFKDAEPLIGPDHVLIHNGPLAKWGS